MIMTLDEIINNLNQSRSKPNNLNVKGSPGLYAIFLNDQRKLDPEAEEKEIVLYVGSSSDLKAREFESHFTSENTGFSTLRRSIGAILKDELNLSAYPRSSGSSESNIRNYKFNSDGEDRLTDWMMENLEIGVCPLVNYQDTEKEVINKLQPLLNLTHWDNPNRKQIKRLRKECAEEAKNNRHKTL